jgi:hypothetical protein
LAGILWMFFTRVHDIVYRAQAPDCEATVIYGVGGDATRREGFSGRWESAPITLAHGDTASVVVTAGQDCTEQVRCELIEDGERVAQTAGRAGATCTAWTGR